ncbi:MAG: hypothetical protein HRU09_15615 [Oligoflexales bacterium]|nr:hypothetical protein [Oligoflexales bacterium]
MPSHSQGKFAIYEEGRLQMISDDPFPPKGCNPDLCFSFRIEPQLTESEAQEIAKKLDIWELLCEPYLDVDMPDQLCFAEESLMRKGLSMNTNKRMHWVVGTGLWWNVFAWEWVSLDYTDVKKGWRINTGLLAIMLLPIAIPLWGTYGSWILLSIIGMGVAWEKFWTYYINRLEQ